MLESKSQNRPPLAQIERQAYFDRYWITRDYLRTDRRTMERAQLIWSNLVRRRGHALDVGCGRGLFAAFLSEQGLTVEATDISPQAVDLTRQRGINAYLLDLETQAPLGEFDLVFCLEVLQQVRDPEATLRRLVSVLSDQGEIVVSVPNEFHLWRRLQIALGRVDFGDVDDSHIKLFTPARGHDLLKRVGLEIRKTVYPSIVPPQSNVGSRVGLRIADLWPAGMAISSIYFARKVTS